MSYRTIALDETYRLHRAMLSQYPRALKGCTQVDTHQDIVSQNIIVHLDYGDQQEVIKVPDIQALKDILQQREIDRRPKEAWELHH